MPETKTVTLTITVQVHGVLSEDEGIEEAITLIQDAGMTVVAGYVGAMDSAEEAFTP